MSGHEAPRPAGSLFGSFVVRLSSTSPAAWRVEWYWLAVPLLLIALRLPSLVQPAGGDQGLYGYTGQRILAGEVMYRDAWDQKPPAIAFLYALLWRIAPTEAVVPAADLVAAAAIAALLVVLGRRRYSTRVGYGAAIIFLLLGDPYLQRLSGIYVRGQCEPFMALAVTTSLVLLGSRARRRWHLAGAGVGLAAAFWLKYNAAAYALPLALAAWAWSQQQVRRPQTLLRDLAYMGLGFALSGAIVLAYFLVNGALADLRLATLDYNLRYSNETYEGPASVLRYMVTLPFQRARADMLWFLGALGTLLLLRGARTNESAAVVVGWVLAAVVSIGVNGSRGLPNYFVQAAPALALAASAGLGTLPAYSRRVRYGVAALLLAALWRVGTDTPVAGWRFASLPGLAANVRYDLQHLRGRLDRDSYLQRFRGQKHDALEVEKLVRYVRETTGPTDPVFVFGFSGGSVGWKSERASPSRFFWSRPVIIEFAARRPGYGPAGLLQDLLRRPPALVALQKEEWRSRDFFMRNQQLRDWLEAGYVFDRETPMFSVWRRKS